MAAHRPIKNPLQTSNLHYTNRLQQIKVFAELFSKSDRLPFHERSALTPRRTSKNDPMEGVVFFSRLVSRVLYVLSYVTAIYL